MIVCDKCNKKLDDNAESCDNCATLLVKDEADTKEVPKKKPLLIPALLGVGLLFLVMSVSVFLFINTKSKKNADEIIEKFVYIKDNELFVSSLSDKKPINIDWDFKHKGDERDLLADLYETQNITRLSNDKKLLFYSGDTKKYSYTLYYRDISKPNKKPVMIDEGISREFPYAVSDDNIVTYIKKSDNTIYQYDIGTNKKTEIDSKIKDSLSLYMGDEGEHILYLKKDGELYFKENGKDKEKLSSDVSKIDSYMYMEEGGVSVLYLKNDKVYKKESGKEEEELIQGVEDIVRPCGEYKFYYSKNADSSTDTLMDYVEDDMKEQDEAMEMPEMNYKYPYQSEYNSKEEYQAALDAYNLAEEEYSKAKDEYEEKEKRDMLREELRREELSESAKELYYFDGKESNKISDKFIRVENGNSLLNEPVIVLIEKAGANSKKVKLSELRDTHDVYSKLGYNLSEKGERVIAVGAKTFNVEKEGATSFRVSSKGDTVYFMADIDEGEKTGSIYEIKVKDADISTPQIYDTEVYSEYLSLYDSELMYFKNCTDNPNRRSGDYEANLGTLYIDKKKIDEKVYTQKVTNIMYSRGSTDIMYYTYYDIRKNEGELKAYDGNETKSIKEAVYDFIKLEDGSILYLCDYDSEEQKGKLKLYKDGENKDIDEEVTAILKSPYRFRY
jgi:hypothetical protein